MSTTMSCFRLLDLPLDLLELLTLYFEENEAVKLLTVSSNFHEIFARSVWHLISRRTIDVAEPTRSSAYAHYGHLVRSIDLFLELCLDFDLHNWAQLFPNTTSMAFDILPKMKDGGKQMFMDAIADLHGLRSLTINMNTNTPPFDLETLATVLLVRHGDSNKQSLRELAIFFDIPNEEEDNDETEMKEEEQERTWADLSSFTQMLSPLHPSIELDIHIDGYSRIYAPTPAQMDILRPYLASIENLKKIMDEDGCTALHNRQLFSPIGTCDDPLAFGQLRTLTISVCCSSPLLFDYSDFTPAKFPVMKSMEITEIKCSHQIEEGAGSAVQALLAQGWPKLKDLNISGSGLTLSTLEKMAKLNPQLTNLDFKFCHNAADTDSVLMLNRVTGHLLHLTSLTLRGTTSILIDSDWLQTASLVGIRSFKLETIAIHETTLTHRLFEILFALPSLSSISFSDCVLAEPELTKNVFKKHKQSGKEDATEGVSSLTIYTSKINTRWSIELVLEMVASMPHLESCDICGDYTLRRAIQTNYPKLFLKL
ncbi:hypothetical protein GQ42DRAFT_169833 [Ramicandelaber brevisporus]|nr:hypothetical protein GQ42DRAFT_169833 [Ramicandelaber brevisporus]